MTTTRCVGIWVRQNHPIDWVYGYCEALRLLQSFVKAGPHDSGRSGRIREATGVVDDDRLRIGSSR